MLNKAETKNAQVDNPNHPSVVKNVMDILPIQSMKRSNEKAVYRSIFILSSNLHKV